jgi:AcrR family transcriptional regulator
VAQLREDGRRSGRRAGDSGTREAILAAARKRFGDHGYTGATMRAIAADADVDPALVHHFFGTKEGLFAAAMSLPLNPGELISATLAPGARPPGLSLGEHLVRTVLGAWDVNEIRDTFLGLLRSAVTSEQAASMLREFVTETILGRLAEVAGTASARTGNAGTGSAGTAETETGAAGPAPARGAAQPREPAERETGKALGPGPPEAGYRAALVASQVLGLALTRYVLGLEPLATASHDDLAAAIGPTVERYLTGSLR